MTVRIEKPALNLREEINRLDKPTGIAGEAMLRAETPQEQFNLIGAGRRNLLINGGMNVNQRNETSFAREGKKYFIDRFCLEAYNLENITGTVSQAADGPDGFSNSFKFVTGTPETSVDSDDLLVFRTYIEAQDLRALAYNTSAAKPMMLSFWVKASVSGDYAIYLYNVDAGRSQNKVYTIPQANTWTYITLEIAPDAAGVINDDNGQGISVTFVLLAGTNWTNSSGARDKWVSSVAQVLAYGHTANALCTTGSATWQITGIQLELGKVATPFEHRSYGEELALCQRYFERLEDLGSTDSNGSGTVETLIGIGYVYTTTRVMGHVTWKATKRVNPTCTVSPVTDIQCLSSTGAWISATGVDVRANKNSARLDITTGSAMPAAGQACEIRFNTASPVGYIYIDAEL